MVRINRERLARKAARIAADHPATRRKAERVADALRAEASKHVDTGELLNSIEVITVTDEYGVDQLAVHVQRENLIEIEYGGFDEHGNHKPGLGIIRRALDEVRGPQ